MKDNRKKYDLKLELIKQPNCIKIINEDSRAYIGDIGREDRAQRVVDCVNLTAGLTADEIREAVELYSNVTFIKTTLEEIVKETIFYDSHDEGIHTNPQRNKMLQILSILPATEQKESK